MNLWHIDGTGNQKWKIPGLIKFEVQRPKGEWREVTNGNGGSWTLTRGVTFSNGRSASHTERIGIEASAGFEVSGSVGVEGVASATSSASFSLTTSYSKEWSTTVSQTSSNAQTTSCVAPVPPHSRLPKYWGGAFEWVLYQWVLLGEANIGGGFTVQTCFTKAVPKFRRGHIPPRCKYGCCRNAYCTQCRC